MTRFVIYFEVVFACDAFTVVSVDDVLMLFLQCSVGRREGGQGGRVIVGGAWGVVAAGKGGAGVDWSAYHTQPSCESLLILFCVTKT